MSECWDGFLMASDYPWCWLCGRGIEHLREVHQPAIIERAHIVNKPRKQLRAVAVLLCSLCHRRSHGESWPLDVPVPLPAATLPEMLWLKSVFDPDWYDRELLQSCCVGRLPAARPPGRWVLRHYVERRGYHPGLIRKEEE